MTIPNIPGVFLQQDQQVDRSLTGAPTGNACFGLVTTRGPIGTPIAVDGVRTAKRIFGAHRANEASIYALQSFFDGAAPDAKPIAYVSRLAHYTDPTDPTTIAAVTASKVLSGIGSETPAVFVGNVAYTTSSLVNGYVFTIEVDAEGSKTATFNAAACYRESGVIGVDPCGDGGTLFLKVNRGVVQTITFTGSEVDSDDIADAINAQCTGVQATVVAGPKVRVTTDRQGTGAFLECTGGTLQAALGFALSSEAQGTGDAADASAVTFAEIKTLLEGDIKVAVAGDLLVVSQNSSGYVVLTGTEPGTDGLLDLKGASTAAFVTALGLTLMGSYDGGAPEAGSETVAASAFKVWAGYRGLKSPGVDGNLLSVAIAADPKMPSRQTSGDDLAAQASSGSTSVSLVSVAGLAKNSILRFTDLVDSTVEYRKVVSITTTPTITGPTYAVELSSALTHTFTVADGKVESVEFTVSVYYGSPRSLVETWKQVNTNPDSNDYFVAKINHEYTGSNYIMAESLGLSFPNYILAVVLLANGSLSGGTEEAVGTLVAADILGDEGAGTGVYAFDSVNDAPQVCVPPSHGTATTVPASAALAASIAEYAKNRMGMMARIDVPYGYTEAQARAYRMDTLGIDNAFATLSYPFIKVSDPLGVGENPTVLIASSPLVCGLRARTDSRSGEDYGPHVVAAGTEAGKCPRSVLGLERYVNDKGQALLNDVGINCFRKLTDAPPGGVAPGIILWGMRTLSTDVKWRWENKRYYMNYLEQSVVRGTRWAVGKNNGPRLWQQLADSVTGFLTREWKMGRLAGSTAEQAFLVKVDAETTTPYEQENGQVIGDFGASLFAPGEQIIWRTRQLESGGVSEEV